MFQKAEKMKYLDIDITEDIKNWILENPEEISLVEDTREDIKVRVSSLETLVRLIDQEVAIEGYSSYEEYDLSVDSKFITKKVMCGDIGVFYIDSLKESFVGRLIDQVYIKVPGSLLDSWMNPGEDYDDDDDDDDYND